MFDPSIVAAAARTKEVELTTYGRKTGKPSRRTIWITALDERLYIRSGLGMTRDWPKNLVANGRGVLHFGGQAIAVRARHVTDAGEARSLHAPIKGKYNAERTMSSGDQPLTPSEQAVFELFPETP